MLYNEAEAIKNLKRRKYMNGIKTFVGNHKVLSSIVGGVMGIAAIVAVVLVAKKKSDETVLIEGGSGYSESETAPEEIVEG